MGSVKDDVFNIKSNLKNHQGLRCTNKHMNIKILAYFFFLEEHPHRVFHLKDEAVLLLSPSVTNRL